MRIHAALLAAVLTLGALPSARAGDIPSDTPEALIRSLYAHHQPGKHKELDTCKRSELSRFCDAKLTRLFLKDCACSKKTHEVCNLDWDPFYDAQDFGEEDPNPRITRLDRPNWFQVTITNLGEIQLTYEMAKTKGGWRISNIKSAKWDLVEVLSGKQK